MAQQANERAMIIKHRGLHYTISDILKCPHCQSRLLSFAFLSIRGFNEKLDVVEGGDDLTAYCLRCRSVFIYVFHSQHGICKGFIPVNKEMLPLFRAWFEASELPNEPDEFPF